MNNGRRVMNELLGKKAIERLEVDLFDKPDSEYEKAKNEWIVRKLDVGTYKKKEAAEAAWDADYPHGKISWIKDNYSLNAVGEQRVIDKLNEVIDYLNSQL